MRHVVIFIAVLMLWQAAWADMMVELDLDGQLGNGPDSVLAMTGDTITTDVWLVGDDWGLGLFNYFALYVEDDDALDFLSGEIFPPPTWEGVPITASGDTVYVCAYDLYFVEGYPGPTLRAARLKYRAVEEGDIGVLGVDLERSSYSIYFSVAQFTSYVGAQVVIQGTSGTEEASWGAVKSLFR